MEISKYLSRTCSKISSVIRRNLLYLLGFVISLIYPSYMMAQISTTRQTDGKYSLSQIFDSLSVNSKTVNLQRLKVLSEKEQTADLRMDRLPDVALSGEFGKLSNFQQYESGLFSKASRYPISHTSYGLGSSAYFNLYSGNSLKRNLEKAKIKEEIGAQQLDLTLSETKLLAAAYYLDLIRDKKLHELLRQDISEQKKVAVQITAFYKNGVVLKSDLLRAELKISKQVLQAHEIQNNLVLTTQKLNLLLGRPEEQIIIPLDTLFEDSIKLDSYDKYAKAALSNAFELKISQNRQMLDEVGLRDAKSNILPQIGLYADLTFSYPQGRLYPYILSLYSLASVGLKASYPLSSLYKNKHKIALARIGISESRLEHMDKEDEVKNNTRTAYLALEEDVEKIAISKSNVKQADENLRILKNSYFNQTALVTDYLDADLQLLQSRFELTAAKVAAQFHLYQLQKILGQL